MENIYLLVDFLNSIHNIYLLEYSSTGELINSVCDEDNLEYLLDDNIIKNVISLSNKYNRPSFINGLYQSTWIIDPKKKDGVLEKIFLMGPFYLEDFPEKTIKEEIDNNKISFEIKNNILDILRTFPILSFIKIQEYAIMMHYAINNETVNAYDLHVTQTNSITNKQNYDSDTTYHGTYEAEKEMLRMVKEGDTRIVDQLKKISTIGQIGKLANDNSEPLRQVKNMIIVAITLFSRAAMEGGLYPDTAMTLSDRYFQAVEAAKSLQEINNIAITMQSDYVHRVRKIKRETNYSKAVQKMVDYIELNIEDDINLKNIAENFGYSEYYLSKKFKEETQISFKEYIRKKRLDRAKFLLDNDKSNVGEIADQLHFPSHSYFVNEFKKEFGVTPGKYKSQN